MCGAAAHPSFISRIQRRLKAPVRSPAHTATSTSSAKVGMGISEAPKLRCKSEASWSVKVFMLYRIAQPA